MKISYDISDGELTFHMELQGVKHEIRATEFNDPFSVLGLSAVEVSVGATMSKATFISEPDGHILTLRVGSDGLLDCTLIWADELIEADAIKVTREIGRDRIHPYDYAKMVLDILIDVKDRLGYDGYENWLVGCHYPDAIVHRLYKHLGIKWWEYLKRG